MEKQRSTDDFILFHLAFPVTNIPDTKTFYHQGLGCELGRESPQSLIMSLFGHQLVAHVTRDSVPLQKGIYPRHFGLVFSQLDAWQALVDRAKHHQLEFYQSPRRRFPDSPLEHYTFFLADPFHNLLEFKHYHSSEAIFGYQGINQIGDLKG
ncbi:VOC family protein [Acaryochloris sp. IP29b_bin.148]|uniref:VOC family protein n=1 Tax=Acaryochloris sp. IP29b_bin.148 TaxID=2969218 RepID=UPI00261DCD76|nr:VOC family protein [Acaryochloris sp. IP29b_bin.148]